MNLYYTTYKRRLRRLLYAMQGTKTDYFENVDPDKKKIIVGLAADYKNLGDVAITYAQTQFLKDSFPDYQIIDYPISQTFKHYKDLKEIVKEGDIITTVGGGNTGDLYDSAEHPRQFLIKNFPNNKIISFPQTVDFSESSFGKHMLNKAKKIYSSHDNLILIAREVKSYNFYQKHFPNNKSYLFPDIVLYLDESNSSISRKGITLTFRSDKEKNVKKEEVDKLIKKINMKYGDIRFRDTHAEHHFKSVKEREDSLQEIWDVFRSSSVVITDRLHGMIFSAITNTPCIAINNSNKKVQRVYEKWLTDHQYITMVEKFDDEKIMKLLEEKMSIKEVVRNKEETDEQFDQLIKIIKKIN